MYTIPCFVTVVAFCVFSRARPTDDWLFWPLCYVAIACTIIAATMSPLEELSSDPDTPYDRATKWRDAFAVSMAQLFLCLSWSTAMDSAGKQMVPPVFIWSGLGSITAIYALMADVLLYDPCPKVPLSFPHTTTFSLSLFMGAPLSTTGAPQWACYAFLVLLNTFWMHKGVCSRLYNRLLVPCDAFDKYVGGDPNERAFLLEKSLV